MTKNKTYASVLEPMGVIQEAIAETRDSRKRLRHVPPFAPAGQSTQLIVGASPESDFDILELADRLYRRQTLKRVYYSAYVPVGQIGSGLPNIAEPPLRRENRLYQADWLMRLYGFSIAEVISAESPYLDLKIDPKQTFAMRHPALFPIDINAADRELILRVPGIGLKSANRIVNLRRRGRIRFEHLKQMGVVVSRAQSYIRCEGLPTGQWQGTSLRHRSQIPETPQRQRSLNAGPTRNTSLVFVTDGTFEGLLTAIFDAYTAERPPEAVESSGSDQMRFFESRVTIPNDPTKSERVWKGLKRHLGMNRRQKLFDAYLSGNPGVETMIYRFVRDAIPGRNARRPEAHLASHIQIEKLCMKVRREAHRMKGFIRFRQTGEYRYLALVAPRYDVLPLIRRHFESRFADQTWIIYDTSRNYGLCYDRHKTRELWLDITDLKAPGNDDVGDEQLCQTLWQRYYAAVNISSRNNPKLHLRQLPRRYWRYLPEKQS